MMAPHRLVDQFLLGALVLICLLIPVGLPDNPPLKSYKRQRSKEPKPFAGLIHKPVGETCEQGGEIARARSSCTWLLAQ